MKRPGKRGFTLIEMLVVLVVIGLLVAIAVPRFFGVSEDAKARQCEANIKAIETAIELYNQRTGDYPSALTDVTGDTSYFPDGEPTCPFDSSAYSAATEATGATTSAVVGVDRTGHDH